MRRTQIYLTDEQDRLVAARAQDAGVAKAEVIRSLLDAGLGLRDGAEERRRAITETFGILPDARTGPAGSRRSAAQVLTIVWGGSGDEAVRLHRPDRPPAG